MTEGTPKQSYAILLEYRPDRKGNSTEHVVDALTFMRKLLEMNGQFPQKVEPNIGKGEKILAYATPSVKDAYGAALADAGVELRPLIVEDLSPEEQYRELVKHVASKAQAFYLITDRVPPVKDRAEKGKQVERSELAKLLDTTDGALDKARQWWSSADEGRYMIYVFNAADFRSRQQEVLPEEPIRVPVHAPERAYAIAGK